MVVIQVDNHIVTCYMNGHYIVYIGLLRYICQ